MEISSMSLPLRSVSKYKTVLLIYVLYLFTGFAFCWVSQLPSAVDVSLHFPSITVSKYARHSCFRRTSQPPMSTSMSSLLGDDSHQSHQSKLQEVSGFSLTTLRSTLRKLTGFSLTTFRATLRVATGISLSQLISVTLRRILEILSPSLRYFLQPFLIMYYAPLLMVRYWMVGPSREYVEESRKGHEKLIEGWRKAVKAAERANSHKYWPVHLNDDGTIVLALPPDFENDLDLADGIEMSVAAMSNNSETLMASVP